MTEILVKEKRTIKYEICEVDYIIGTYDDMKKYPVVNEKDGNAVFCKDMGFLYIVSRRAPSTRYSHSLENDVYFFVYAKNKNEYSVYFVKRYRENSYGEKVDDEIITNRNMCNPVTAQAVNRAIKKKEKELFLLEYPMTRTV